MLTDASGDFCCGCSPEKRIAEVKQRPTKARIFEVGTVHGMAILDVMVSQEEGEKP